jgi:hypothetical protein
VVQFSIKALITCGSILAAAIFVTSAIIPESGAVEPVPALLALAAGCGAALEVCMSIAHDVNGLPVTQMRSHKIAARSFITVEKLVAPYA